MFRLPASLSLVISSRLFVIWLASLVCPVVANAQTVTSERVMTAIPGLESLIRQQIDTGATPGLAIAIVHNDEVVYLKGFGLREVGKVETVDPDTVFQLASLSKPISSTIVAALVSDGVVSWDSRVADLDPSFRLFNPYPTAELTIRDLFSHRSGVPGAAGNELEDIGYGRSDVLARLRLVPPSSSFRAGYSYSNFGLTEGAIAAAKPTGKDWETIAEDKLYRPLGMASTSSRHADFLTRANRAALHVKVDGAWAAKLQRDPDAQAPAGGVSSSARDLAQWLRLELGGGVLGGQRLISQNAIEETHVPLMARGENSVTGGASFYGLGWNVEFGRHGLSWGHAGAFSVGARTLVTIYPKAKLGIVILTNAFPTGIPEGIADSFADLAFDGKIEKDWLSGWNRLYDGLFGPAVAAAKAKYASPPNTPSTLPGAAYAGRYANAYIGDAFVAEINGTLQLKVGPGGRRSYALHPFARDLFLYFPDPETPDKPSAVQFTIGADGKASDLTIESLNDDGLGVLKRVGE